MTVPLPIEVLDLDECQRLLLSSTIGRIAVVTGGAPIVFPVNYVLDGTAVVFRTSPGTKLSAAGRGPACFEVDEFDATRHTGWSVIVQGRLEEVTGYDSATHDRLERTGLLPWAYGVGPHWMRLVPEVTTGRRVGPAPDRR